jgi:signal transduction protein with GAF and PtsI domain
MRRWWCAPLPAKLRLPPFFDTMSPQDHLQTALHQHDCQTGTLHLLDPTDGQLKLAAQIGLPPHVVQIVTIVPVGKGMAGLAAERLEPVQTCNLQTDVTGDIRPGAKSVPVQASIAVPMLIDGALHGVLGLAKAEYHEWTEEERTALALTASTVARQLAFGGGSDSGADNGSASGSGASAAV